MDGNNLKNIKYLARAGTPLTSVVPLPVGQVPLKLGHPSEAGPVSSTLGQSSASEQIPSTSSVRPSTEIPVPAISRLILPAGPVLVPSTSTIPVLQASKNIISRSMKCRQQKEPNKPYTIYKCRKCKQPKSLASGHNQVAGHAAFFPSTQPLSYDEWYKEMTKRNKNRKKTDDCTV